MDDDGCRCCCGNTVVHTNRVCWVNSSDSRSARRGKTSSSPVMPVVFVVVERQAAVERVCGLGVRTTGGACSDCGYVGWTCAIGVEVCSVIGGDDSLITLLMAN